MSMSLIVKQSVILAAGKGVRLDRPDTPKPLVSVGNKPMILWNIEHLQNIGVDDLYAVVGFRGNEIKRELTDNPGIKAKIHYINQQDDSKEGMLKSILSLSGIVSGPFFLVVSDLVIQENPYDFFNSIKNDGEFFYTLISSGKGDRSGALSKVFTQNNNVESIGRDLDKSNGLEVGVYYFPDNAINYIRLLADVSPQIKSFDELLKKLVEEKMLKAVFLRDGIEWFDVNTPATHIRAEIFARNITGNAVLNSKKTSKIDDLNIFSQFSRTKLMRTDISIAKGLLNRIGEVRIIPEEFYDSPHFIITDSKVNELYGDEVLKKFLNLGYDVKKLVMPAGEEFKKVGEYIKLADEIFSFGMDKKSILISLGGGVVNNMAGFLASTLYRGIGLIHIPTTTMAQVDAAIDFKQAINSPKGKNLLGSYHPAMRIVIDPEVLITLDGRHINNGIAESIKHALTQDPDFFKFLIENYANIKDIDILENIIRKTIELKVPLLNGDTKNDRNEMLPQYGHSIAHAIEHLSSYDLLHGEAISVGMCITAEISKLINICDSYTVDAHYDICRKYSLPVTVPDYITAEDIINMIRFDKHHIKQGPEMALLKNIGNPWDDNGVYAVPIDYEILKRAISINKSKKQK